MHRATTAGSSRKTAPSTSIPPKTANTGGTSRGAQPSGPTSTPATCRSWRPVAPANCPASPARLSIPRQRTVGVRSRQRRLPSRGTQQTPVDPSQVHLDPTKRYYISMLPGDAANPFIDANLTADCTNGEPPNHTTRCDRCSIAAALRSRHGRCADCAGVRCGTWPRATGALQPVTILTQPDAVPAGEALGVRLRG